MKKDILVLLAILMVCSCGERKESGAKAPTRVKTQLLSPALSDDAQTYVGIVEEREGTAVRGRPLVVDNSLLRWTTRRPATC